jgi:3-dehydroquinate dehydratase type I
MKLIISFHDYDGTPSVTTNSEGIIRKARLMGADIVKIATLANSPTDSAVVLKPLYSNNNDLIAFCMGKEGIITRIAAPLLGAEFTFAAHDESCCNGARTANLSIKIQKIYEL